MSRCVRAMGTVALLATGWARAVPASPSPAAAEAAMDGARARVISEAGECIPGPQALGSPGDILLENEAIRVVIDAIPRAHGFAWSGGNILDAAPRQGSDRLNQLFTCFDDRFPRQAVYRTLAVADPGGSGRAAVVLAEGADGWNGSLRVRTTYRLEPGASSVRILSTLTNTGTEPIEEFGLGDVIEWGGVRRFVPGEGWRVRRGRIRGPWIAGAGAGASYGYTTASGVFDALHGRGWSDPLVRTVTLAPGDSATYERWFVVGMGDVASVAGEIFRLRGERTTPLAWTAAGDSSGMPVGDARLVVWAEDGGMLIEAASAAGAGTVRLPPGTYRMQARAPGRKPLDVGLRKVTDASAGPLRAVFAPAGRVRFTVRDVSSGAPLPARLTLHGLPPFDDPDFGEPGALGGSPASRGLAGENATVFAARGSGEIPLAPGRYRVWAAHGTEWEMDAAEIAVTPGDTTAVDLALARAVQTPGALAADFHVHTVASFDSPLALEDRVIGLVASGVEIVAVTDHNGVTDLEPWIATLGAAEAVRAFAGSEITTRDHGHFNAFPLERDFHLGERAERPEALKPAGLFARVREQPGSPILQVNHPFHESDGYFQLYRLEVEPALAVRDGFQWDFDTLEILNGDYMAAAESLLVVWAALWNSGRPVWGVGCSDSHDLTGQEAGCPRTYLLGAPNRPRKLSPGHLVELVRGGRMVVTNGPWLMLEADGRGPGETRARRPGETVVLRVSVDAPAWVEVATVDFLENGRLRERFELASGAPRAATHWSREIAVQPERDAWYAAIARGPRFDGPDLERGARGAGARDRRRPFAFTNPVRVDADADGRWAAPGRRP